MAFQSEGMKTVYAFKKGESNNTGYKQPVDRLVTIISYNLAKASMLVQDLEGNKFEVTVEKKAIARATEKEKTRADTGPIGNWSGYAIDQRMEKALPVTSSLILERTVSGKQFRIGKDTVTSLECGWIHHVTNPEKTYVGLMTVSSYQKRISSVQLWAPQAIAVDNQQAIEAYSKQLDENAEAIKNKEYRPGLGVQFRVVIPSTNPKEKSKVIDTSPPFDWIPGEKDASGKTQEGRALDGDKFVQLLSEYINEYVEERFANEPNKKVEILTYTNYFAAPKSTKMTIPDIGFHPYNKLAYTETRLATDDAQTVTGKNIAVNNGILELTDDGVDKVNKTFFRRDMAKALHANNYIGNLQSWVKDSNGNKCEPHPDLRVLKAKANDEDAGAESGAGSAEMPVSASASASSTSVADPFASGADPFEDAGAGFHEKPTSAAAPAPTPAPETAETKPATGASTRRRNY